MQGEDVYALQKALNWLGAGLEVDGILGRKTGKAIWDVQPKLGFLGSQIDGRAGQKTQRGLVQAILAGHVDPTSKFFRLGVGAMERESLFILGNYSPPRPNQTYDAGVVQRNSQFHELKDAFDPVDSIALWVRTVKDAYARYSATSKYRDTGYTYPDGIRRFKLAGGSWNAPAFANYYAGVEPDATPNEQGAEAFLDYIEGVGVYL